MRLDPETSGYTVDTADFGGGLCKCCPFWGEKMVSSQRWVCTHIHPPTHTHTHTADCTDPTYISSTVSSMATSSTTSSPISRFLLTVSASVGVRRLHTVVTRLSASWLITSAVGVRASRPGGAQTLWLPLLADAHLALRFFWTLPPAPTNGMLGNCFVFGITLEHHFWLVWRSFRPLLSQAGAPGGLVGDPLTDDAVLSCKEGVVMYNE